MNSTDLDMLLRDLLNNAVEPICSYSASDLLGMDVDKFCLHVPQMVKKLGRNSDGFLSANDYLFYKKSDPGYTRDDLIWCRAQRFVSWGRKPEMFAALLTDWATHIAVYQRACALGE